MAHQEVAWPVVEQTHAVPWVGRTTDLFVRAGIREPRWCARAMETLFGAAAAFAEPPAPGPDATDFLWRIVEECAQSGTHPLRPNSGAAFSAVVLPAWLRAHQQYTLNGAKGPVLRDAFPPLDRAAASLHAQLQTELRRLVDMGLNLGTVTRSVLALPAKEASERYLASPIWRAMCATVGTDTTDQPTHPRVELGPFQLTFAADAFEEVGANNAYTNGVAYKLPTIRASTEPLRKVRAIYCAMDPPTRYTMHAAGGDYRSNAPPREDGRMPVPRKISSAMYAVRMRWLRTVYDMHVRQYVLLSLCVAHAEFLSSYFRVYTNMVDPRTCVAAGLLKRAAIREFACTMDTQILDQLMRDLTHPAVPYTHDVHEEEARYWIWCALERELAEELLVRARAAAREATTDGTRRETRSAKYWHLSYARSLEQCTLSITDIVGGLELWSAQVTEQWLDRVLAQWQTVHDDGACTAPRVTAFWAALKNEARERGVIGPKMTLPSIHGALHGITRLAYARFVLYTFHEETPALAQEREAIVSHAVQLTTDAHIAYLRTMTHPEAEVDEMFVYFGAVWVPLVGIRSTPRMLFEMHAHLADLRIPTMLQIGPVGTPIPDHVRDNPGGYVLPLAVRNVDVSILSNRGRLARLAVNEYRDRVAALNWHTHFFAQWTRPNIAQLCATLSYVARMDAYEHMALQMDTVARARPMQQPWVLTCEELGQARLVVCAVAWPLYRKWESVRVTWSVALTLEGGAAMDRVEIAHDVPTRITPLLELHGATLLSELRGGNGLVSSSQRRAAVLVRCTVDGVFHTAADVVATERFRASRTCILNILDY